MTGYQTQYRNLLKKYKNLKRTGKAKHVDLILITVFTNKSKLGLKAVADNAGLTPCLKNADSLWLYTNKVQRWHESY